MDYNIVRFSWDQIKIANLNIATSLMYTSKYNSSTEFVSYVC